MLLNLLAITFFVNHVEHQYKQFVLLYIVELVVSETFFGAAPVISKPSQKVASAGKYLEFLSALGDYNINRQIIHACQQWCGGACMSSMFGGR
jgi:hypothetical protein